LGNYIVGCGKIAVLPNELGNYIVGCGKIAVLPNKLGNYNALWAMGCG